MAGIRFTAWLAESERSALRRLAHRQGCSENYLVRISLRSLLLGEPVPSYILDDIAIANANDRNDSNGGNDKDETARTAR